ncbi:MAG TPA: ABC transporter permease [Euryarchaeota archaeon]|nr:MAG: hypothetical protein B6U90_06685 [Thermoplasmatales archaeon ex4484_6]HHD16295.1 ABC transporter permease [Euryarchaeota archaeon]
MSRPPSAAETSSLKVRRGKGRKARFSPVDYILKDLWRNRSRTIMSMSSVAALSFLFVLFSSMDAGFADFFSGDTGVPSDEQKELYKVKGVMENWVYLITALSLILMALVVSNTGIITVVERRFELATLRALGISMPRVIFMVSASLAMILYGGVLMGTVLGLLCIPLLDRVSLTLFTQGIGFPLSFDPTLIWRSFLVGTLAGAIGASLPLIFIARSSPLEVLRDG